MKKIKDLICTLDCFGLFSANTTETEEIRPLLKKNITHTSMEELATPYKNEITNVIHVSWAPAYEKLKAKKVYNSFKAESVLKELEKIDWKAKDSEFGNSAFIIAILTGHEKFIDTVIQYMEKEGNKKLLEQMTARDTYNTCLNTPLLLAIKNYESEAAVKIVKYYTKVDLLYKNFAGNSALHWAAMLGMNDVVQEILNHAKELGCLQDVLDQKNKKGYTAYDLYILERPKYTSGAGSYVYSTDTDTQEKILTQIQEEDCFSYYMNGSEQLDQHIYGRLHKSRTLKIQSESITEQLNTKKEIKLKF